jgi:hypothetical protein
MRLENMTDVCLPLGPTLIPASLVVERHAAWPAQTSPNAQPLVRHAVR